MKTIILALILSSSLFLEVSYAADNTGPRRSNSSGADSASGNTNLDKDGKPKMSTSRDDKIFDNISMDRALKKALTQCSQKDLVAAKQTWLRVIEFMHQPRWFPTAAMVPICLDFAKLAEYYIDAGQIADAHELMHASFEFPFHVQDDYDKIDTVTKKLIDHDKLKGDLNTARSFLKFAISKIEKSRQAKYQEWLQSLN